MKPGHLRVLYFARLREELGRSAEEIGIDPVVDNVAALARQLASRGGVWQKLSLESNVRVAVNQEMADARTPVKPGDEVAFFPPVTGG
jgi:molybdopterin synthase sulfur carrier subunit